MESRAATLILGALLISLPVALLGQSDCSQPTTITAETKTAAEHGDSKAEVLLARAYESGCGLPQNEKQAFLWAQKAAEQGDAAGETEFALLYRLGIGTPKDPSKAVEWYRKAARQGFTSAIYNLATCYFNGEGVPVNDQHAYAFMMAAGDAGFPNVEELVSHIAISKIDAAEAQMSLGTMYELGVDLPQNYANAAKWYRKAVSDGNPAAHVALANLLFRGKGVRKNDTEGFHLCETAAKHDFGPGLLCDAYAKENGMGTEQNIQEAIKNYTKAAEFHQVPAAQALSRIYAEGKEVPQDFVNAYTWLLVAEGFGFPDNEKMASLSTRMNRNQIAKASRHANDWLNKHQPLALRIGR